MKAGVCEEAGGAHAESSCGAAIPGTVRLLKLAQNTEPNYRHRQVALPPHGGRRTKAATEVGIAGKKDICYVHVKHFVGLKISLNESLGYICKTTLSQRNIVTTSFPSPQSPAVWKNLRFGFCINTRVCYQSLLKGVAN